MDIQLLRIKEKINIIINKYNENSVDDKIIKSKAEANRGDVISITLYDGKINAIVGE